MPTLGSTDIAVDGGQAGSIAIVNVHALSPIYPRLGITLDVYLADQQSGYGSPNPLTGFELRDLSGELRLSEHTDTIGSLTWVQRQHTIRSSRQGYAQPAILACDIDHARVEQIERRRAGQPLRLWIALWPSMARVAGTSLNAMTKPVGFSVSHEDWARVLDAFGWGRHEIIEVRYNESEAAIFQEAIRYVRGARHELMAGRYDRTVGDCRLALDSVRLDLDQAVTTETGDGSPGHQSELSAEVPKGKLESLFAGRTDPERGANYIAMFRKLKRLRNLPHHVSPGFSRAEAQFIVRTTENLLGLIGALTLPPTSMDH